MISLFSNMNLQKKSVMLIAGILFLVLGTNTAVLTGIAFGKYRNAMLAKSGAIGELMRRDLSKAVILGIPVESLDGVNEKLSELLSREKSMGYAMVISNSGKVLFHNQQSEAGKELKDEVTAKVTASQSGIVQTAGGFYDLSFPLSGADNKAAGYLRIGILTKEINSQLYELLFWAVAISGICFLLSIALLYFAISRFLTKPIVEMESTAESIASGNLTVNLDVKGKDEISSLQNGINRMAVNLKDMLSKVSTISNSVTVAASNIELSSQGMLAIADVQRKAIEETTSAIGKNDNSISQIALSAENLSESATSTSSSVHELSISIEKVAENSNLFSETAHETASSIEEMVSTIKSIAESLETLSQSSEAIASSIDEVNATTKNIDARAHESVKLAETVTKNASEHGLNAADAAIHGMENIRKGVVELSEIINSLGKRTEDIGKILNVIDDVADQTNLLAINAAILASKAGEHGKGFAVVADEIKNLAERTSFSTNEIAELIRSVQDATKTSIRMASEDIHTVETGLKLVKDVNFALKEIVESSMASTEMARAIQRATEEEALAIRQITDSVERMTEQTENISRAIQEQSKGSRFIIDATEKVKDLSQQVKESTGDQRTQSRQIAGVIENVTNQAFQIADAIGTQKENSAEIVHSMEKINNTTGKLILSANEMNSVVGALKEEAYNLLLELKKFRM